MIVNGRQHWRIRPPTQRIPKAAIGSPGFVNLIGTTFGMFEVVDYLGKSGSQRNARWLVRCLCGRFECRTAKAMKSPDAIRDECISCNDRRRFPRVDPSVLEGMA